MGSPARHRPMEHGQRRCSIKETFLIRAIFCLGLGAPPSHTSLCYFQLLGNCSNDCGLAWHGIRSSRSVTTWSLPARHYMVACMAGHSFAFGRLMTLGFTCCFVCLYGHDSPQLFPRLRPMFGNLVSGHPIQHEASRSFEARGHNCLFGIFFFYRELFFVHRFPCRDAIRSLAIGNQNQPAKNKLSPPRERAICTRR